MLPLSHSRFYGVQGSAICRPRSRRALAIPVQFAMVDMRSLSIDETEAMRMLEIPETVSFGFFILAMITMGVGLGALAFITFTFIDRHADAIEELRESAGTVQGQPEEL